MASKIFQRIVKNLTSKNYDIQENIDFNGLNFEFVGHSAPLQASKFGKNDYFVVGYIMQNPSIEDIRDFSAQVFEFAKDHRANKLLPGIFGGYWSLPVILVDGLQTKVAVAIEQKSPPKHYAAFEFPIVIDSNTNRVHYFMGTPAWGAVYFEGLRELAQEITA